MTVKLLPFDNKSELSVTLDLPEGSSVEAADAVAQKVAKAVLALPEGSATVEGDIRRALDTWHQRNSRSARRSGHSHTFTEWLPDVTPRMKHIGQVTTASRCE
ncbi:hypothetical protein DEA8626_02359 [Defluviimonas aquaemixtae]|uniref:Uncharacterized protein n=1 Tax=Albidovulum aquaemixtae TaxID=1542388 RepID=A0A2R8B898_9RHOB|nr:efflux RND transporter permease subunit [Defluviimonas aquaemixtae]SPH18814.1 hypothetical protein DEA8626_02359 [Defluviimonas aquaemixtae]